MAREDLLPKGWRVESHCKPRKTNVNDASGQPLKILGEVTLSVFVGATAMPHEFLVVKGLVPLTLG